MFEFLGILVGIAVRSGNPLSLNLAEPMWKLFAGIYPNLQDISEVDKHFVPKIMFIKRMEKSELSDLKAPFSVMSASGDEIKLSSTEEFLTPGNKEDYINLAVKYRLHEYDRAINMVRKGIAKVVPLPLVSLFTANELA